MPVGFGPLLAAVVLCGGCRSDQPATEEAPPQEPAVTLPDPFEPGALATAGRGEVGPRADLTVGGAFAHEPHGEVACEVCHSAVPGHSTHAAVACRDCHPAPGPLAARVVSDSECLSCHHLEQTVRDCVSCHTAGEIEGDQVQQRLLLSVWDVARDRAFPFAHSEHPDLECSNCHVSNARQTFDTECADCHEPHHDATVRCASCHGTIPADAHDANAHRGCGGVGCHDTTARPVPPSRARCLACHIEQEEHEPGQECSRCHLLNADSAGPAPATPMTSPRGGRPW